MGLPQCSHKVLFETQNLRKFPSALGLCGELGGSWANLWSMLLFTAFSLFLSIMAYGCMNIGGLDSTSQASWIDDNKSLVFTCYFMVELCNSCGKVRAVLFSFFAPLDTGTCLRFPVNVHGLQWQQHCTVARNFARNLGSSWWENTCLSSPCMHVSSSVLHRPATLV